MDPETTDTTVAETDSLATELAKALAISAATTVGMIAGASAYGYVRNKIEARKDRKAAEAIATETE